jgi:hypothetical protein
MHTPRITPHAAERCRQMGISTKVPKRIIREATMTRPGYGGRIVAWSVDHPDFLVVYVEKGDEPPMVVTVLWKTSEWYQR